MVLINTRIHEYSLHVYLSLLFIYRILLSYSPYKYLFSLLFLLYPITNNPYKMNSSLIVLLTILISCSVALPSLDKVYAAWYCGDDGCLWAKYVIFNFNLNLFLFIFIFL